MSQRSGDIVAISERYASGEASPVEVLDKTLRRADTIGETLNLFACVDRSGAMAAAEESAKRWGAGRPLGPLDGAILTIKDNITVRGMPCAWGSRLFAGYWPDAEEPAVARLREAGAILLGKTNVSEFTIGRSNVNTDAFGITRNPWDPAKSPGASSGGAAAALAAGIGDGALATDGGGSIRRPASHCGLVGLKPSRGRVPRRNALPAVLHDCEVLGVLARSIADADILYEAIAASHPGDSLNWPFARSEEKSTDGERRLRILYVPTLGAHRIDPAIAASCDAMAGALAELGHTVETGDFPADLKLFTDHWPVIGETGLARLMQGREWRGRVAPHIEEMVERGQKRSASEYAAAIAAFGELACQLGAVFQDIDVLLTPAVGAFSWPAEINGAPQERIFTGFVNVAGLPALSVPSFPSPEGMPIGIQLVASFGGERTLFQLGAEIERHLPWQRMAPLAREDKT